MSSRLIRGENGRRWGEEAGRGRDSPQSDHDVGLISTSQRSQREERKGDRVGRIMNCNAIPRKIRPGQREALKPKSLCQGFSISQKRASPITHSVLRHLLEAWLWYKCDGRSRGSVEGAVLVSYLIMSCHIILYHRVYCAL